MYNIEIFIFGKYTGLSKKAQIFYNYETYAEGVAHKNEMKSKAGNRREQYQT